MGREATIWAAAVAWLATVAVGFWYWERYDTTPGRAGASSAAAGEPRRERWQLTVFAHPRCPCTRAGLRELADITRATPELSVRVRFVRPAGAGAGWERAVEERVRERTAELWQTEERFRRAFDDAATGMALVAPDGRFLRVNRTLCEIVGYSETELHANTFQAITHPDDLAADVEHLQRTLRGEVNTYQMEAGKLDLDPLPFSVRDAIGDTLKALAARAHGKGLELACDTHREVPELLLGDANRLRQILTNLVGNAVKFTERGEVVVRCQPVAEPGTAVRLQFRVADTGIGISTEKLRAVFEPFTQADGSTTRKYGGTGLGLTICLRLVELMGGRIWAERAPGKGSTFMFEARLERTSASLERAVEAPLDLTGVAVLIVDDNATNRRVLAETVRNWGARPTCAGSGPEALDELRWAANNGTPFPLVLLDGMMPEMDGFMVAQRIGRDPALAGPAILMLTSADRQGDAARCRELDVATYRVKPV